MRRHKKRIVGVCGVWMICVAFVAADAPPEETLAAEGLLHSAMNLYHTPTAVARAGRLVAISEYLATLDPGDPRAQRLLADVYQSQGKLEAAAKAARALLDAEPDDFTAGTRWLRFRLDTCNRAGERSKFLTSVLKDETRPKPLRSAAAVELARVDVGQGIKNDAFATLQEALKLDPLNNTALLSLMELTDDPTPVEKVRTMLALLKGNPRAYWVARELAGQLCDLGLYEEGLDYYRHAWALWQPKRPVSDAPADFAAEYVSALLDAGKADAAVSLFDPAVERLKTSTEFASLMIEAYTKAGQNIKAEPLRKEVEDQYRRQLLSRRVAEGLENPGVTSKPSETRATNMTAEVAVNLAWYYLLVEKRPAEAARSIAEAVELGAKGDAVNLCTGAAQVQNGDVKGLKLLEPLAGTFPLAAAYVARYELAAGQTEKGTKTLLAGLAMGRRNLAFRMLAALAKQYNVTVPPVQGAQAVATMVKEFDPRYLEMGLEPGKFIRITVTPAKETTSLCEPIRLSATLENIGPVPVSVDAWGLLNHRLGLKLHLQNGGRITFPSMPMLLWPAPRYLPPNEKVTASCRLDVGAVARFLANHPLLPVTLRVEPIVSPREVLTPQRETKVLSELEPMKLPGPTIRQQGLLASQAGTAREYNQALANLREALAKGDLPARVMAARRVAAILAWIRDVQNGKVSVPPAIRPVMNETYVLGLMGMALRDKSDVVRAEMITSLQYADMGSAMLNEVGLVVEDPSPLVRFRVAELLGASGTKGNRKLIDLYAKDADPRVRTMARAFLHAWRKTKSKAKSK